MEENAKMVSVRVCVSQMRRPASRGAAEFFRAVKVVGRAVVAGWLAARAGRLAAGQPGSLAAGRPHGPWGRLAIFAVQAPTNCLD